MDSCTLVLLEVASRLPSIDGSVFLSSGELGITLDLSQQSASRYLNELEGKGLIKRVVKKRGQEISLTIEGISVLKKTHGQLDSLISGKKNLELDGKISIGLGEGAYYVEMYSSKIKDKLGFTPYYGTLNVTVDEIPSNILSYAFDSITKFEKDGRSFGGLKLIKVKLSSNSKSIECILTVPERTHHKKELELISEFNLREKLGLENGSKVSVTLLR